MTSSQPCQYLRCGTNKMNCPKKHSDLTKTRITDFCFNCASHSNATEQEIRDKVLGELLVWVKKNNINYEDADGDRLPVIVTGKIMNKIEELRTPTPEAHR